MTDERQELERLRKMKRLRELEAKAAGAPPQQGAEPANFLNRQGFLERAANAATFNFGDELAAGGIATLGGGAIGAFRAVRDRDISQIPRTIGQEFRNIRDDQRAREERFEQDRPGQALGADIVGGIVGGGKVAGALAPKLGGLQGTARGAAILGAGEGAAFAAGAADGNVIERADDAAVGAVFGGAGGAAFQKLANRVQGFWRARAGKSVATEETKKAFNLIRNAIADEKGSRGAAEKYLRQWMRAGANPDDLLQEAGKGPVGRELVREIANRQPTPALEAINRFRDAQAESIKASIRGSLKSGRTVEASREALRTVRQQQAAPLFERAARASVPDGFADDLIRERPAVRQAVKKAARELANAQEATPFNVLKVAKENLDDRASALFRAGKQAEARRIVIARNELRTRLTSLSDDYRKALDIYAGTKEVDDALDLGRKFLRPTYGADDLAADLKNLGSSEREFHKVAVAEEFEALIDRARDSANKARFVGTEAMRKKIRLLFDGDEAGAQQFINILKKSEEGFELRRFISPETGSQTAPRLRAQQLFEEQTEGRITRATLGAAQNPLGVPRQVFNAGRRGAVEAKRQRISEVLAKALFEGAEDPFAAGQPFRQIDAAPAISAVQNNQD